MNASVASDAWSIDRALNAALDYDSRAYAGVCRNRQRMAEFRALQARARDLNDRFVKKFQPGDIVLRNVDRRPVHTCAANKNFSRTVADWGDALSEIELALNEAP